MRLEADGDQPLFTGIARTRDVDAYLRDSAHATLTESTSGPSSRTTATAGHAAPGARATRRSGPPRARAARLTWNVEDGDWSVVVMNADGSPRRRRPRQRGASVPFVDDLGDGLSIASLVLVLLGGTLLAEAFARPR